jgi:hypothetical protein
MSADILDDAADHTQAEIDRRVLATRRAVADAERAPAPLPETCDNGCGERPRERSRWCSVECREDGDRRKLLERRTGKR